MKFILLSVIFFNAFLGFNQNINKIFKTIKKGEIDVAYEELKTFQKTTNQNEESVALGLVAEIMIFGSNKYSGYNPYNSIDLLRRNKSILDRNSSQVNEMLVKLNTEYLSLESQYLTAIYEDAVKFNDEIIFYKAKQYCGECQFKDSLNYYLELNVYNSAKNKRTVEECKRFILDFSSSKKVNEITELRNLIAFEQIKQQPNLTKINEYLQIYPSSKHFESVTIMRDSIEYASLKEDYQEHLNYIVKYPNSTFNDFIKDKLPKLLFNEVLKTNKTDDYIKFLKTYPNYTSIGVVKEKLENILYSEIKISPSIIKLQQYKKYFPTNNRIEEINKLLLDKINAHDFDNIHKSKLIKIETVKEGDINYRIESYEAGTIKYRSDAFGKGYADDGTLYQSSNTIVKSILSDSSLYIQTIDIEIKGKKTVHKTILKRSLMHKKNKNNEFEYFGISHGEQSKSVYLNDSLIESKKGFYYEGKLNGKMTRLYKGQLIIEENYIMGINNGIEIKSKKINDIDQYGKYTDKYFIELKGEWLDGEKKGKWETHEYITIKEFLKNRKNLFVNFKFNLSDTSIIGKCIEENFHTEIKAIPVGKIEEGQTRGKEDYYYVISYDVINGDAISLIDIVETREYFPDGNIDEKVYLENEYTGSGSILERGDLPNGSKMERYIKDDEYYPQEFLEKWQGYNDYGEIRREKFNFQKENPLLDDGHTIAFKQSKLIKIEIFINGKLYCCEGDCD
jgi:hypothetical protein